MTEFNVKFSVGQLVHHKRFDYRGVIIDVDAEFHGSDDWYHQMATSKPPRENPWYHVLVDESDYRTYVAERNLEPDTEGGPIKHPDVRTIFSEMSEGRYVSRSKGN